MTQELDRTRAGMKRELVRLNKVRTSSTKELSATMKRIVELNRDLAMVLVQRLLLQAYGIVVLGTPVDTGFARVSWQMGTKPVDFIPTDEQAARMKEAAQTVMRENEMAIEAQKSEVWYLVNNAEYIYALEAGWSKKQPGGFIAMMLAELQSQMNIAVKSLEA